ncbi:MAG: hypothetical protein A2Y77_16835 [Planctomycetes bacterium RBG_13_62_9]|nr:MAG: hypothetical protein A2Y77_16835 [Planctomycetes bacterium RBG_13_62_9]
MLLVALLTCTVALQVTRWTPVARAGAVWLDDDPNDPQPESIGAVCTRIWLDDEPQDPNEPNDPSPQPELF